MISLLRKTRPRPVRTFVAVMNSLIGLDERLGGHQPGHQIGGDAYRGIIKGPASKHPVQRAPLEWTEGGGERYAPPKIFERSARTIATADKHTVREHRGVHGAC